jgi:hypothetical protein
LLNRRKQSLYAYELDPIIVAVKAAALSIQVVESTALYDMYTQHVADHDDVRRRDKFDRNQKGKVLPANSLALHSRESRSGTID